MTELPSGLFERALDAAYLPMALIVSVVGFRLLLILLRYLVEWLDTGAGK